MFGLPDQQPNPQGTNPFGQMDPVQALALLYASKQHQYVKQYILPAEASVYTAQHANGPLGQLFGMNNPLGNFILLKQLMGHHPFGVLSPSQAPDQGPTFG